MKKILFINGYKGVPDFFIDLKNELDNLNFEVKILNLDIHENARFNKWVKQLSDIDCVIDENTIIIAHLLGNPFIIKYISKYCLKAFMYIGINPFSNIYETTTHDINISILSTHPTLEDLEYFNKSVKHIYTLNITDNNVIPDEILNRHKDNIKGTYLELDSLNIKDKVIDLIKK